MTVGGGVLLAVKVAVGVEVSVADAVGVGVSVAVGVSVTVSLGVAVGKNVGSKATSSIICVSRSRSVPFEWRIPYSSVFTSAGAQG